MLEHTLTSWAQEMSPGPCELKSSTSVSAAQRERVPGRALTQAVYLVRAEPWNSTSEAQTGQGHPPEGVLSLQDDMGLCLQSHFGRFWGFFLADSPQRVKLFAKEERKMNSQRRTCLPQNLRGTKTRWLHFQRHKHMGQEVSQYYKRGLRPVWDWRSTRGIWQFFVQASKYCENKSEGNKRDNFQPSVISMSLHAHEAKIMFF